MLHIGRYFAFTRKHDTSHTSFFHTKIRLGNLRTLELYTLIWGIILPRIWTTFRFDMLHVELIILLLFYTLQVRLRLQWESWFLSSPPCLPSFSDSTSLYKKEALLKGKTKKKRELQLNNTVSRIYPTSSALIPQILPLVSLCLFYPALFSHTMNDMVALPPPTAYAVTFPHPTQPPSFLPPKSTPISPDPYKRETELYYVLHFEFSYARYTRDNEK